MSKKVKGSRNRKKQKLRVACIHETVERRRDDFLHKWSNHYIQNYDRIAVEKLNIKNMLTQQKPLGMTRKTKRGMNRNTLDAAWGKARTFLTYKAERAGCQFVAVDPAYTTQTCYCCGNRVKKELDERIHHCKLCEYTVSRDLNSALMIRKEAFKIGWDTPKFTLMETRTSVPISELAISSSQ